MNKDFYSIMFLSSEITKSQKLHFLERLLALNFTTYIYESNTYEKSNIILNEYFEDNQFSMRYKNEDFVFSCAVGRRHLSYRIDANSEDSKIIIEVSDLIPSIFGQIIFNFIEYRGESPNSLEKYIKSHQLYWLFSINYFDSNFIDKYGLKFFQNFPAEKVEFIENNLVKIQLVKDLSQPISGNRKKEVQEYLNDNGINNFEFYDYKNHFID